MLRQIVVAEGFLLTLLLTCWATSAKAADEKQLFVEMKCAKCHPISALDIAKKGGGDADEEGGDEDKTTPPDLSDVGKNHDAAFFSGYLKKETAHVAHAGCDSTKKHKIKFKGTDDEVKRLADWMATLKLEPKK
jgi:hypothetical protein